MKPRRNARASSVVRIPTAIRPVLREIGRTADRLGICAYAVGGCVRDWLLRIPTTVDLDVTVEGDGIAFARRLAQVFEVSVKPHEPFGTATLELFPVAQRGQAAETLRIDVASCRKETYAQPAAYPKVVPGRLQEDLFRRDFTINAMAVAINGERFGALVDPFQGLKDLQARRLRILHANSFIDDPSRLLRAVRFTQRFGLTADPQTSRMLRQALAKGMLGHLNRGRLRKELERMVQEPDPVACLACLGKWLASSTTSAAVKPRASTP